MQYIGVGWRALATVIDTGLLAIVAYVIAWLGGTTTEAGFELRGGPFFLMTLIMLAYYITLEGLFGSTVGKMILGLRVVKLDGSAISWRASVVRNLLRFVDGIVFYLVGAILIWTSPQRQRLGDRLAETVVIRLEAAK
mgnify:CR=1 FL=1